MKTDSGIERHEIYRAIGELAYVGAKSDRGLAPREKAAFYSIAREELDYDAWAAVSRFQLLDEVTQPSLDRAYNDALFELRKYSAFFTDELKEKALVVLPRM